MRKSLKIVLTSSVLLIIIGLLLCLYFFVINRDDNVYVQDLSLSKNDLVLKVNDSYAITNIMQVEPSNYNVQIMCYAENSKYVSIVNGYTIKANSVGETKVIIKALCDKDSYINEVLSINVIPEPVYPENFVFEKSSVSIEVNKIGTNKIVTSTSYTVAPAVTYSVGGICLYNYQTGEITALKVGTTTVNVKFTNGANILSKSFEVIVSNVKSKIVVENCNFVNNEYTLQVVEGDSSRIYYNLLDSVGEATEFDIGVRVVENNANCEILSKELGCVKFICDGVGESIIQIYSLEDETIYVNIKLVVGEKNG